jgi:hypothetical protein
MKLLDVISAADARVSGGDPYLWSCYGSNAQFLEFRDSAGNGYSHVIFDRNTYECYEIHVEVPNEDIAMRWVNPLYRSTFYKECEKRGIDPSVAWDNVNYTHVDTEELILEYVRDLGNLNYENVLKAKT